MADGPDDDAVLQRLFMVEELDTDLYRGQAVPEVPGRVFGGQVIAQALAAASRGVEEKIAHSLHAYFLRAGDNSRPIIYRVLRDFDGRSFANRRVVALQNGKPILNLAASFQRPEEGLSYAAPMPDVPGPEAAIPMEALLARAGSGIPDVMATPLAAFELRAGARHSGGDGALPTQHAWLRLNAALDPALARVALAYASDYGLIATAVLPHGIAWFSPEIQGASLDHAIWFHDEPRPGEWLLYATDSPWSGHGRGFSRGSVYNRAGRLIATTAQEGLMRYRPQG